MLTGVRVYGAVRKNSARQQLGRRIIALAAAYAIALSGLIASFGAASAAAAAAGDPGSVLCHSVAAEQPSPASDDGNQQICADSCCLGCLMSAAALPPAPVDAVPVLHGSSRPVAWFSAVVPSVRAATRSHQSRAPPPDA
jgi:hypothetical protein